MLPGEPCLPTTLSARNRIISGLSRGVLIIEASPSSGCHLTAAHCIDQNRELFCVPPPDIFDLRYSGVKPYLRDGAIAVYDKEDVLIAFERGLNTTTTKILRRSLSEVRDSRRKDEILSETLKASLVKASNLKKIKSAETKVKIRTADSESGEIVIETSRPEVTYATPEEEQIANFLAENEATIDVLADKLGLDFSELSDLLLSMELDGFIQKKSDGKFVLT